MCEVCSVLSVRKLGRRVVVAVRILEYEIISRVLTPVYYKGVLLYTIREYSHIP